MPRPLPPALTHQARHAASLAGVEARRERAEVKKLLRAGSLSAFQVINDSRNAIQRMKVLELLEALPGVGAIRAQTIMERIEISPSRRIAGLGERQLLALRNERLLSKIATPLGALVVMSGPGGVGKSTITSLLRDHPSFWVSISATTREPRINERDGVDYFFVSDEKFDEMIAAGEFLEWAEFAGNRYGTPKTPVSNWRSLGKHVLLEIEIAGARQIRATQSDALLVFISPPSWEALKSRLTSRGTDTPERQAARLALAQEEMAAAVEFDHNLVNSRVEEVATQLLSLALAHSASHNLSL